MKYLPLDCVFFFDYEKVKNWNLRRDLKLIKALSANMRCFKDYCDFFFKLIPAPLKHRVLRGLSYEYDYFSYKEQYYISIIFPRCCEATDYELTILHKQANNCMEQCRSYLSQQVLINGIYKYIALLRTNITPVLCFQNKVLSLFFYYSGIVD